MSFGLSLSVLLLLFKVHIRFLVDRYAVDPRFNEEMLTHDKRLMRNRPTRMKILIEQLHSYSNSSLYMRQ